MLQKIGYCCAFLAYSFIPDAGIASPSFAEPLSAAEGHGLFEDFISTATVAPANAVAIGDVTGDNLNDVVLVTSHKAFADEDSYKLFVYQQDINGDLLAPVKYAAPVGNGDSVDLGDFNGDGRIDVVVGGFATAGIYYQTTTGSLTTMAPYNPGRTQIVRTGDFNNDGRDDVAATNWATDTVVISLQDATGGMTAGVHVYASHGGFDELSAGDVNNDGRDDIVVMSGSGTFPDVTLVLQNADGTMSPGLSFSLPSNFTPQGSVVGDVNGDELQDLLLTYGHDNADSRLYLFPQTPAGVLTRPPVDVPTFPGPQTIQIADVDRDKRNDVVVLYGGSTALGIHTQTSSCTLNSEVVYPLPYATHYQGQALAIGDINRDGGPDIAVADYNNGLTILYHTPVQTAADAAWGLYE